MAKYVLRRHSDGKLIETDSATTANDLVANGVAKPVRKPEASREESAPKRKPVVETKADESK